MAYQVPGYQYLQTSRPQGGPGQLSAGDIDVENVKPALLQALNAVGQRLGKVITIFSGYRTSAYSASVGGFAGDPHTQGIAADSDIGSTPIGDYPGAMAAIAAEGLVSGNQPGFYQGQTDPSHVQLGASASSSSSSSRPRATKTGLSSSNVPGYVPAKYVSWVQQAAQGTGLPASIVAAQIEEESGFDASATSSTGAQGMAQIEPGTFKGLGIPGSPYTPSVALLGYVAILSANLKQFHGNIRNALAAYNAGSGNLAAGYGYADTILANAGAPSSATAGASSPTTPGRSRPGGQPSGQSGNLSGIEQAFSSYEALLNTPRQAPPGIAASLGGNAVTAPFRWFLSSFTGNWSNVDAGPTEGS